MDDCIRGELSTMPQLKPFDAGRPAVGADGPWRHHYVPASYTPDGHEFSLGAVSIEFLNGWRRKIAHDYPLLRMCTTAVAPDPPRL